MYLVRFTPPQDEIGWANKGQQSSKFWSKQLDTGSSLHFLPRANSKNPAVSTRISNFVDPLLAHPILSCGGVNHACLAMTKTIKRPPNRTENRAEQRTENKTEH